MSNPILTVFDDAGNAIPIPAFPWVTEGGGGLKHASGTWTPASKTARMTIDLDFVPKAVSVWLPDFDTNGLNGTAKVINALYVNGLSTVLGTNASGTSVSVLYTNNTKTELITNDINSVPTPYVIRVLESGGFTLYNNREFPAGYTYAWEAWGE